MLNESFNYNMDVIDALNLNDKNKPFRGTIISGHVDIIDKFGNKILDKDNLVVLRGRGFVLKKLFSHPEYDVFEDSKQIMGAGNEDFEVTQYTVPILFTVGNNGIDGGVSSVLVKTPKYDDLTISNVGFKEGSEGAGIYHDSTNPSISGKAFSKVKYVNDTDNNESYVLLELELSGSDFQSSVPISEAGLLFGNAEYDGDRLINVTDLKLMSHITFNTITLNTADKFTVRYYLYA